MVIEILSGLLVAALVTSTSLAVWVSILRDTVSKMRLTNNGLHERLVLQASIADDMSSAAERLLVRMSKLEQVVAEDTTMAKTTRIRLLTEIKK